ncbi:hypothetical protein QYE76_066007 [Lolium multiflorum]|uniref:PDZ domain-containing protein n=1 Tax=Lolium multiflorum TaxID=4521 RepID=A0AAD8S9T8_LOLMU|nr:hypothetical protein QYE76_066007 [Lolium multiflorum]
MTKSAAQDGEAPTRRPQVQPETRRRSKRKPASSRKTTQSRARAAQSPKPLPQSAPPEQSTKRRKRARAAVTSSKGDDRNAAAQEEEEEEVASDASSVAAGGASPTYSSPLCVPRLHYQITGYTSDGGEIYKPIDDDMSVLREYDDKDAKYQAKLARRMKLPTLDMSIPSSFLDEPEMVATRVAVTKTILRAAKSVLALSASIDGRMLPRCSGFLIEYDDKSKSGIVVTTADLICSRKSIDDWSGRDVHCPNAKVYVHLLDSTSVEGCLICYQKDYNLAFFKISVGQPMQLLAINHRVEYAQEVFLLGRDESLYLTIGHGRVLHCDRNLNNRHHYMNVDSTSSECVTGGPAIDLNGEVVGMASIYAREAIIPSFIILECWHFWRRHQCIPRPHLGLKFSAIKFRSVPQIDKISREYKIEDGLIVQEVSEGSLAEKRGVRVGDIVTSFNGKCISDTVELEHVLLRMSEDHFYKGKGLNSKMKVKIGVFHMHNRAKREITLSVNVSESGEVVLRGLEPEIGHRGVGCGWKERHINPINFFEYAFDTNISFEHRVQDKFVEQKFMYIFMPKHLVLISSIPLLEKRFRFHPAQFNEAGCAIEAAGLKEAKHVRLACFLIGMAGCQRHG